MKKLHFEAPEGWFFTYEEGYEDGEDENGNLLDTYYVERLDASDEDDSNSFYVAVYHDLFFITAFDIIESEAKDYLKKSGFVIPEYLIPSTDDLICQCKIAGYDAYYYLIQKPGEENAAIRMIFDTPDGRMIYINADLSNWRDSDHMIEFLNNRLSFVEGEGKPFFN